ncbi:MAG: hypothetical protein Q4A54_03510 [Parabacteroides sp.]|nr:hypothetical protein [Parabacteroides sp.]
MTWVLFKNFNPGFSLLLVSKNNRPSISFLSIFIGYQYNIFFSSLFLKTGTFVNELIQGNVKIPTPIIADNVKYGIKLGYKNIGFNGKFYTFPYFLTFLLKRFVAERL